jgi:hypothetical protein
MLVAVSGRPLEVGILLDHDDHSSMLSVKENFAGQEPLLTTLPSLKIGADDA